MTMLVVTDAISEKHLSQRTQFARRARNGDTRAARRRARKQRGSRTKKELAHRAASGQAMTTHSTIRLQGRAARGVGGRVSQRRVRRLGGRCARRLSSICRRASRSPAHSPSTSAAKHDLVLIQFETHVAWASSCGGRNRAAAMTSRTSMLHCRPPSPAPCMRCRLAPTACRCCPRNSRHAENAV